MREGHKIATFFTVNLIREAVLSPNPAAERNDFQSCLTVIDLMVREAAPLVPKLVRKLWQDLRGDKLAVEESALPSDEEIDMNENYMTVFAAWLTLVEDPTTRQEHRAAFIHQMLTQGVLDNEDNAIAFWKTNLQMAIGSYHKCARTSQGADLYRSIDAYALLVVSAIEFNSVDGKQGRLLYLTKIISMIVVVLVDMHETQAEQFQQKPFFRIFSRLLYGFLRDNEETFKSMEFEILAIFGEAFDVLQPEFYPVFTFSWWALVSHQAFMPKLLNLPDRQVCLYEALLTAGMASVHEIACRYVQIHGAKAEGWIALSNCGEIN
jgi:CCR4-NOT transcription complex subunit 1